MDLWHTALLAESELSKRLGSTASNWAVFDGHSAGQPLPHAHVHVVPRRAKDLEQNDEVYGALERWAPEGADGGAAKSKVEWPEDEARRKRTGGVDLRSESKGFLIH